ncbi:nudix hydrolase 19, chloroplastic-like isoform X4 [Chenopodium quinoa]|uniref:nudix hydrolase 19, chloroplastic-like isoform X4 n=1 Tax=Chenopodium quinoa TaxID=63459 RepID=UPI000B780229|nr:nudix hydrolase 19, chloroplastic-like isoform X4 [Chenopodium quinoa]
MPLLLSSTPTTASLFLKLTFPLAFLRFSTMSSINLQSHAFAGNPIKAKIPKSNDPFSPNSALEALKSHLLGNTHDAIALNFKVLPFRKGRPLAGSQGSSPNWHLGWLSLGDCKGLLADSSVKFEGDSLVYLGSKSEEDSVYWAIDVSEDDKLVDELGKKYFSFVELRTLMVATDWSDSRAMADLAVAGHEHEDYDFEIGLVRSQEQEEDAVIPNKQPTRLNENHENPEKELDILTEVPSIEQPQNEEPAKEPITQEEITEEEATGSGNQNSRVTIQTFQPKPWKHQKSHPLDKIISDLCKGTQTRSQMRNFCSFNAFLSTLEPRNHKEALEDPDWIIAMQEELNEFERNQV